MEKLAKRQQQKQAGLKQALQKECTFITDELALANSEPSELLLDARWSGVPREALEEFPRLAKAACLVQLQEAAAESAAALRRYDPEPLRRYTVVFSRALLQEETVEKALHWLLDRALIVIGPHAEKARATLIKILDSPVWQSRGVKEKLTKEERRRKEKESNLQIKHDHRAVLYCDRAWNRYMEAKERLRARGATDTALLRKTADDIERKEFSRGGAAKEKGKRFFRQRVERDLT